MGAAAFGGARVSADWRQLPIYDDGDEEATTFGARLEALRQDAVRGEVDAAFDHGLELGLALHAAGLDRESLELLDELASFVTQSNVQPERWPWLLNSRGMALSSLGRYQDAEAAYSEMQQLAQALPGGPVAEDLISTAAQNRGILALEAGAPERAVEFLREALPVKVKLEDWVSAVDVLNSLALAVAAVGDLDEAERMLSSVEKLSALLQDPRRMGAAFGNRGLLRARRGDFVGAEEDYRTALQYARADADPLRELLSVMNVGASLADQGRYGQALRWYRRGARWAAERGAATAEVPLRRGTALMLLRSGRPTEAVQEVESALELAQDIGHARYAA